MPTNDPQLVKEQYATEANLRARQALYEESEGNDPREVLWQQLAGLQPRKLLEVGGGPGELAERMRRELGCSVAFVDQSERMVELARRRGIDAEVGDVENLRFPDATFDTVIAAWMLYHVQDIDRALSEVARVLVSGGTLVAVTDSVRHLSELRELVGVIQPGFEDQFHRENGEETLRRHFSDIERIDTEVAVTVRDRAKLVAYQQSLTSASRPIPEHVDLPLVIHARSVIFRATK